MTFARLDKQMHIAKGDFADERIVELLRIHHDTSHAVTPAGSAQALDLSGLQRPDIDFWALWRDEALLCVGALRRLSRGLGEVKSMHTAQAARRTGAASAMLAHIVAAARARGLERLNLETGSFAYFAPSRALYAKHGFVECGPYGQYRLDPNSTFMTLAL